MKNYNIYYRDSVITVSAEQRRSNEFGQAILEILEDGLLVTVAIIPKEILVIKTDDLTEYQQKLKDIISDLEGEGFNDLERKLPNFNDYKEHLEYKRLSLLSYFKRKLKE